MVVRRQHLLAAGAAAALSVTGMTGLAAQTIEIPVPEPITGGALGVTPPTGTQTATVSGNTATIALPYTVVEDTRTVNGSPANGGWTVTVGLTTPLTRTGGATIPAERVTWTTGTRQKQGMLNTWANTSEFSAGTGTLSGSVTAAQASPGGGSGTYRYNATVTVDVTGIEQGTYTGALTQTVN